MEEQYKVYDTAIYTRLSDDDGGRSESNSILNQKQLILDFVKDKPEFKIYDTYVEMKIAKVIQFENMNPRQKARNKGF
ncbi:hypothetical protein LJC58_05290 [Lachnospiraceae bacterium OttesenSCG-928-D06]|nr:hypothetical protein [Lachnospiraceae bacterium OttesenSCG-928-D06]